MLDALSQETDWRATICRSLLLVAYAGPRGPAGWSMNWGPESII